MDKDEIQDDTTGLPFPQPIERRLFAGDLKDYNQTEFLLSIHKYQTLSDIRKQLREWSIILDKELVDIVNQDYDTFVGLRKTLRVGTESTVHDIRMAILAFRRDLNGIRDTLQHDMTCLDDVMKEARISKQQEALTRRLVNLANQIQELELSLDDLTNGEISSSSPLEWGWLKHVIESWMLIHRLTTSSHELSHHAYLQDVLRPRIGRLRFRILAEMHKCLSDARSKNDSQLTMQLLNYYRLIGHEHEAIAVLKKSKQQA